MPIEEITKPGSELMMKEDNDNRCRSLVCDPNGIIVAEMVYRCMICFYITDTMMEAKQHYSLKHMDDEDDKELDINTESFAESEDNNLSIVPQLSSSTGNGSSYYAKYSGDEPLSPEDADSFDPYSPLVTMTEGIEVTNGNGAGLNGPGGKSGYVNCAVCGVTRFYSCVQRRYGQFTCVTCYRYFRTFLLKPKKYSCQNLGECLLNVRNRCRACWLKACIDVFSVDLRRQHLIEDYRPVRKAGAKGCSTASSSGPSSTGSGSTIATADSLAGDLIGSDHNRSSPPTPSPNHHHHMGGSNGLSHGIPDVSSLHMVSFSASGNGDIPVSMMDASSLISSRDGAVNLSNGNKGVKSVSALTNGKGVKVTAGKKVWSCGKCVTCMAEDCGKCIYCLDRPKFGGPFIKKQRCIKRRCLNKVKNKAANGSG
ncbi:uncharacterized protein LOC141858321 [Brevipalpus obovatus]|uniref:uncharacterized protein LOC141858321 n=1 Tax=Brevipalpus obovatus TaxID=246614 RepID=UPI003D9F9C77